MVKTSKLNNPQYTEILLLIFKEDITLKELEIKTKTAHSTFMEKIRYLEKLNLIRQKSLPGYNRKKPIIMYSGITSFMFLTFFKDELTDLLNNLPNELPYFKGLNYNSPNMVKLIKKHLENEFKDKEKIDFGLKELFHRLIIKTGNKIIDGSVSYKNYNILRGKVRIEDKTKLSEEIVSNPILSAQEDYYKVSKKIKKMSDKRKIKLMEKSMIKTRSITEIDAFIPFLNCVSFYVSEITNRDFLNIMKNNINETEYLKHKEVIDDIYNKLRT